MRAKEKMVQNCEPEAETPSSHKKEEILREYLVLAFVPDLGHKTTPPEPHMGPSGNNNSSKFLTSPSRDTLPE